MRIRLGAVLVLSVLGISCRAGDHGFRTIEGRVYARLDNGREPVDPVAGATVSNNWDQVTATTDHSGRFVIRLKRVAADEFMILRVDAAGNAACRRLAGTAAGPILEIFLDGSPFGTQRCESS